MIYLETHTHVYTFFILVSFRNNGVQQRLIAPDDSIELQTSFPRMHRAALM